MAGQILWIISKPRDSSDNRREFSIACWPRRALAENSGRFDALWRRIDLSGSDSMDRSASPSLTAACLLITNVSASDWCAQIDGKRRLIGRDPVSQILIPPQYTQVSRRHAEVWSTPRGLRVCDVGSSGGTRVNGIPLVSGKDAELWPGDHLSLGGLELLCVTPEEAAESESSDGAPPTATNGTEISNRLRKTGEFAFERLLESLTGAELEIVRLMSRGVTTPDEMGKLLYRSPHTVRTQLNSIYRKLDVHSREELLAFLIRIGYSAGT